MESFNLQSGFLGQLKRYLWCSCFWTKTVKLYTSPLSFFEQGSVREMLVKVYKA